MGRYVPWCPIYSDPLGSRGPAIPHRPPVAVHVEERVRARWADRRARREGDREPARPLGEAQRYQTLARIERVRDRTVPNERHLRDTGAVRRLHEQGLAVPHRLGRGPGDGRGGGGARAARASPGPGAGVPTAGGGGGGGGVGGAPRPRRWSPARRRS